MTVSADQPAVLHIYQNHHLDSRRWGDFKPRTGDIVISTSYKAGTTLAQTILANLLFPGGDMPEPAAELSPWLDVRTQPLEGVLAKLEAQTHRRVIKSHLPLDGLPFHEEVQYLVVGRDPRDVFMSLVNHYGAYTAFTLQSLNETPGRVGDRFPPYDGDLRALWRNWTTRGWFEWESDGWPYWSHLHHARSWWEFRHLPNVHLIHYNDLRADLEGQMRALAATLGIEVPDQAWPAVVEACRFETVKANPEKVLSPHVGLIFEGGGQTFINKGVNGRWRDVLSGEDLELYDAAKRRTLSPDCARWLEHGGAWD